MSESDSTYLGRFFLEPQQQAQILSHTRQNPAHIKRPAKAASPVTHHIHLASSPLRCFMQPPFGAMVKVKSSASLTHCLHSMMLEQTAQLVLHLEQRLASGFG